MTFITFCSHFILVVVNASSRRMIGMDGSSVSTINRGSGNQNFSEHLLCIHEVTVFLQIHQRHTGQFYMLMSAIFFFFFKDCWGRWQQYKQDSKHHRSTAKFIVPSSSRHTRCRDHTCPPTVTPRGLPDITSVATRTPTHPPPAGVTFTSPPHPTSIVWNFANSFLDWKRCWSHDHCWQHKWVNVTMTTFSINNHLFLVLTACLT